MIHYDTQLLVSPVEERELVRQLQVTRLLLGEMGGSLSLEQVMAKHPLKVLDVACGTGGWALDIARTYPALHVTGIDRSGPHVRYAQQLAYEGGLSNARFLTLDMHALATGPFDPDSFDLINVAFIAPTLLETDYKALMISLLRMCRPGGLLRWTEMEFPITTGPAFERMMALVCQALEAVGHTFLSSALQEISAVFASWRHVIGQTVMHPERRHLGITPMMGGWLRSVGCCAVESLPTVIEVSAGTPSHPCFIRQVEVFGQQIFPFLCEQHVITADALAQLLSQVAEEIRQEAFCGLCWLLTVSGRKSV